MSVKTLLHLSIALFSTQITTQLSRKMTLNPLMLPTSEMTDPKELT